jgi:peptidoglycan/LPS O-acetylase OafA/YrhL
MPTIDAAFNSRRNSLNAIRLGLALIVVVSHAWPLGGYGDDPVIGKTTLGHLAVFAFFAISGYLITASRTHSTTGRYLWHRFLRIFPAYWVCLFLIATTFAPISYALENGTLRGFPIADAGLYAVANSALRVMRGYIDGTLTTAPYSTSWNGSTWTLAFEFACYLIIAALFLIRALTPKIMTAIFAACALLLCVESFAPGFVPDFQQDFIQVFNTGDVVRFLTVFTPFVAGSLLYMVRDRVPVSPFLAAVSAVILVTGLLYVEDPSGVIGLPLAYLCVWLAIKLPLHNLTGRADFSYGLYIYAYPVAQVLAAAGVNDLGLPIYLTITLIVAGALAVLSWYLVERPTMRHKKDSLPAWLSRRTSAAEMIPRGTR